MPPHEQSPRVQLYCSGPHLNSPDPRSCAICDVGSFIAIATSTLPTLNMYHPPSLPCGNHKLDLGPTYPRLRPWWILLFKGAHTDCTLKYGSATLSFLSQANREILYKKVAVGCGSAFSEMLDWLSLTVGLKGNRIFTETWRGKHMQITCVKKWEWMGCVCK